MVENMFLSLRLITLQSTGRYQVLYLQCLLNNNKLQWICRGRPSSPKHECKTGRTATKDASRLVCEERGQVQAVHGLPGRTVSGTAQGFARSVPGKIWRGQDPRYLVWELIPL